MWKHWLTDQKVLKSLQNIRVVKLFGILIVVMAVMVTRTLMQKEFELNLNTDIK